ncbi:MAG TPA: efflux transporter outer membrane subunit [Pirellulales bacterium]|nr:efflux transporter outer membrane subunit [Pirellulales bacterium]
MIGLICGCTPWGEYVHNGFKVGPNYGRPAAPVARDWIDANDVHVRHDEQEQTRWWSVFHDPALDALICTAYRQNLTLRAAGFRILEARAQLGIDTGNLFPQTQDAAGAYRHSEASRENGGGGGGGSRFSNNVNFGFNMAWELDFWGRFRRAIESDSASLDASVELYDAALLTLLGDIATDYVQMRTTEQQIKYAEENVRIQRETLRIVEVQVVGPGHSELDIDQARSTLLATEAAIPELEISLRQSITQLCILLGIPPEDLRARLGPGPIPTAPAEVVVGIPADLLRRRPDVRAAERQLAAQCALIGVAESAFYPAISINGSYGWSASNLSHLFEPNAITGSVGPSFQWNVLNYGRILNGVRFQDAKFQELLATYQNTVLAANQDVENGLVTFLRGQVRTQLQQEAVDAARKAVDIATFKYKSGSANFTTVTQVQQTLVVQENTLAQAQGEIVTGLIQVYRALGGGWQIRLTGCNENLPPPGVAPAPWQPPKESEEVPAPTDVTPPPLPQKTPENNKN